MAQEQTSTLLAYVSLSIIISGTHRTSSSRRSGMPSALDDIMVQVRQKIKS
jgi:hypothetical protein